MDQSDMIFKFTADKAEIVYFFGWSNLDQGAFCVYMSDIKFM